jgi:choline transport protein
MNTVAVLYLIVAYIFTFFPLATPVTGTTMNWSVAIYGGVIIFALSYYYLHGRHVYEGPVVLVKQDF